VHWKRRVECRTALRHACVLIFGWCVRCESAGGEAASRDSSQDRISVPGCPSSLGGMCRPRGKTVLMPTLAHRRSVPAGPQISSVTTPGSSSGTTPPGGGRLPKDDAPRVGCCGGSKIHTKQHARSAKSLGVMSSGAATPRPVRCARMESPHPLAVLVV